MIDMNPTPVDGKWYDRKGADKRQDELLATMPTGTNWYWIDENGSEVVWGKCAKFRANTESSRKLAKSAPSNELDTTREPE